MKPKQNEFNLGGISDMSSGQPESHLKSKTFMSRVFEEATNGALWVGFQGGKYGLPTGFVAGVVGMILDNGAGGYVQKTNMIGMHTGIPIPTEIALGIGAGVIGGTISGIAVGGFLGAASQITKELGITSKNLFSDRLDFFNKPEKPKRKRRKAKKLEI